MSGVSIVSIRAGQKHMLGSQSLQFLSKCAVAFVCVCHGCKIQKSLSVVHRDENYFTDSTV